MFPDVYNCMSVPALAVGDGIAPDAAALGLQDTIGPTYLPPNGVFRIEQNLIFQRPVVVGVGAYILVDPGVVVLFNGGVVAADTQPWILGAGQVFFNRKTREVFGEWWGADPTVWSGAFWNQAIAAATPCLVQLNFTQGYPVDQTLVIPAGMPVVSSGGAAVNGGNGVTDGIHLQGWGAGYGTRQQLPIVGGFPGYGIKIDGISQAEISSPLVSGCGDGLLIEAGSGGYTACGNRADIRTIVSCNSAVRVHGSGSGAASVAQANEIEVNFVNQCREALFWDNAGNAPGWDGDTFNFYSVDPIGIANARVLKTNLSAMNRATVNIWGWLANMDHATGKYIDVVGGGGINCLEGFWRFSEDIDNYGMWNLPVGTGNRLRFNGDNASVTLITASNVANSRGTFNAGKPVTTNRMPIRCLLPAALANGSTVAFYVYHVLADLSEEYETQPYGTSGMNGFIVDRIKRGSNPSEVQITLRNVSGATKAINTPIDMFVTVGGI